MSSTYNNRIWITNKHHNKHVLLLKVAPQQEPAEYIKITSKCHLTVGQSYSVHCEPEDYRIQPKVSHFWSGLGTEVATFNGTDRTMSILPSIDSRQIKRC